MARGGGCSHSLTFHVEFLPARPHALHLSTSNTRRRGSASKARVPQGRQDRFHTARVTSRRQPPGCPSPRRLLGRRRAEGSAAGTLDRTGPFRADHLPDGRRNVDQRLPEPTRCRGQRRGGRSVLFTGAVSAINPATVALTRLVCSRPPRSSIGWTAIDPTATPWRASLMRGARNTSTRGSPIMSNVTRNCSADCRQ